MKTNSNLAGLKQAAIVNSLRHCRLFFGLSSSDLEEIASITTYLASRRNGYVTGADDGSSESITIELTRGAGLAIQARDGLYGVPLQSR